MGKLVTNLNLSTPLVFLSQVINYAAMREVRTGHVLTTWHRIVFLFCYVYLFIALR